MPAPCCWPLTRARTCPPSLRAQSVGTTAACQEFIDRYLSKQEPGGHALAITVDVRAVGNVGLSNIDLRHDTAWVLYWVATPYAVRGSRLEPLPLWPSGLIASSDCSGWNWDIG